MQLKKLFFALVGVTVSASSPGLAQPQLNFAPLQVLLCRVVPDDAARLKCFDEVAKSMAEQMQTPQKETEAEKVPVPAPVWDVTQDRSPIDDSPQVSAILLGPSTKLGLATRCKDHKIDVALVFQSGFVSSSEPTKIIFRLNSVPAQTVAWNPSSNGKAAFSPTPASFIAGLPDDAKLFARVYVYGGSVIEDTFAIGKFSEIRNKITAACPATTKQLKP